jgi:uncharacterized protein (DUF1015 family)
MAYVAPFRALRYDPSRADLAKVVTQPYDKITPEMQSRYYAASPYNLVRIVLGKPQPDDHLAENIYTRAAAAFHDWRRQGIFLQDPQQSLYQYIQRFQPPSGGTEQQRRGFIALGRIEDYSAGIIHRHEQTLAKPKVDRLELLRATRAHFGQLFMLYSDPAGEIDAALSANAADMEIGIELQDEYGVLHQVRAVSDPRLIDLVRDKMRDKKLIIADGHHRYDRSYFSVEEVDPSIDAARAVGILREAGHAGTALLGVTADRAFLFDTPKAFASKLFADFSLRQQSLDVVQLHKCLLENTLGISEEAIRDQKNLSYVRDAAEALARVREGSANVAFLMNPIRMKQVRDIALAGEVLPQKSTDFYPKLLSGLTIYALE